jgi:hypothetical protein
MDRGQELHFIMEIFMWPKEVRVKGEKSSGFLLLVKSHLWSADCQASVITIPMDLPSTMDIYISARALPPTQG